MKFFVAGVTIVSLIPSIVGLTIDTPTNVVQCQPVQIAWRDGQPPFYLSILPGGQPSAPALKSFPPTDQTALTWFVDLQSGVAVTMSIRDSTGNQAFTSIVTINPGSVTSCVNSNVTISESAGTSAPTTAGNTSPPTSGTTTSTSSSGSSTTKLGSSSPASTSRSAASQTGVAALGLAGIMGLVGAALF
ncbi:hypothetical protein L208DRAFT_1405662 [Tricholoma matsutake]|nr:hypothetical protein L208DRAFT_1405662 [Tricholoma matsutake 945]